MSETGRSRVEERAAAWTAPPGRRRWSQAEGRAMLAALQASGAGVVAFAQRHGLHEERVRRWVRRAGRARPAPVTAPPGFAPVRLVAAPPAAAGLEVTVGGAVVCVRHGFDAALLRQVVAALGGAPC